jgi:uncharacterized OB-fold protein
MGVFGDMKCGECGNEYHDWFPATACCPNCGSFDNQKEK